MSDEDRPKKRAKKAARHECTVILIDVGANMSREGVETTDMQLAKDTVEWIITRKIFTESIDKFTLMLFGSEVTQNPITTDENIFFYEEEMQQAKIDWLRFIDNEIKPSKSTNGDFLAALIAALDYMRNHLENYPESNITVRNILLVTNLGGFDENVDEECVGAIINGMKALEINFSVVGPSFEKLSKPKDEIISSEESAIKLEGKLSNTMQSFRMEPAERILTDILTQTGGVIYSFSEALPVLQRFVPRKVKVRGQKFYLELGIDFKLPLQMYKKIQPTDFKLATQKYASITDVQLKRKTIYEKCVKDEKVDDGDDNADRVGNLSQGPSSKISKEETIKGYKFGTTIVPYNEEDQKEYGWKPENRCLKLIQFTKRSQILEHYLMDGGACYFIPPALDKSACIAISALVNAMIAEDSVALTRYVYSAASHPRIMCLFPRRSKKGVDMFVGIQLPFYEDFRGLDFPQLNSPTTEPKSDDLKAMHTLVEAMDLTKAHFNSETGQFEESLRPRDVPNPKLQNVCSAMKYRALHPNIPLPAFDDKLLGSLLEPNAFLLKRAKLVESLNYLKANFPIIESPSKEQHVKEVKEEILPGIRIDNSVLPESGKFIKTDEVDV
uniref:VWFA domain-containing protein n=1 Tax=Wuchereria bancrofti TaxID=6293 RepID=A0AAF5Q2Y4_WUCBA